MAGKHYIVRRITTHQIVDRNCHDRMQWPAILDTWGAGRYEILPCPSTFDRHQHCLDADGKMVLRQAITPTIKVESARAGDQVKLTGLPPGANIKINDAILQVDEAGEIEYTSRHGDDFFEGIGGCCGHGILPDADRVAMAKTTPAEYLEKDEHAKAFTGSRGG